MQIYLSVDPGSKTTGIAEWSVETNRLLAAYAVDLRDSLTLAKLADSYYGEVKKLYIEKPHYQPGRKRQPRINDLITLALAAGSLAGVIQATEYEWILPSDWKRQIPKPKSTKAKYIVISRCAAELSSLEKTCIRDTRVNEKTRWDIWDAIGIGLVALGRLSPGLHSLH